MGTGSMRDYRAEIRKYMAEHQVNYTTAKRAVDTAAAAPSGPPDDGFGGHEFDYEARTDLFRCHLCGQYEATARSDDGPIEPCTGLPGYGGDTERVYLLLHENPRRADLGTAWIAGRIRETGIGRTVRFGCRDGRWLVESAPRVVDELQRRVGEIPCTLVDGGTAPAFTGAEQLSSAEGRQVIAENYAAYVAKYGVPQ
ncbi:hypothetical protein CU254_42570 (plasmid) [Amycolatopsis sp. AA4]|uniref:hypothetical protein n=1 Tax=Actinomycetes TaxID=1760 RepID=UPI0001B57159|nr:MULTISPECIES: hypothetical protein [Actinomycetes]ATY17272.1 hypothetical protein CU254_42570 [Amycolatopsis sp. AA4]EFL12669.1 predicted protein [Streptomyces sp. AA4]